ncbi:hypothetical protein JCM19047_1389 [Bacillus sp. JCM 19047]|uniref:hypothetical protein n=1 Tax=Shouchella miscanthi TaxID=2598861 RepID=UPI0003F00327|nr:hypothetical protein [Shouchella miscanthi]GAF21680.1 hypothetical protein JCM19047_1389 [Bacillus sp. JCM 19047]
MIGTLILSGKKRNRFKTREDERQFRTCDFPTQVKWKKDYNKDMVLATPSMKAA